MDVQGLSVVYRRLGLPGTTATKVAAKDVSLSLAESEILGLVGESGSGKSTTGMAIAGLVKAAGGEIRLLGRRSVGRSGARQRLAGADVQVIFQDPHAALDPRQRIGNGFKELRKRHRERASWITDEELMELVGLRADLVDVLPHQLSGGQAQRVCIARAILVRPRVVIADEPTSALDVSVQAQILALLKRLAQEQQIGILFISHDLAVVRGLCRNVLVMKDAQVVESGPTDRVLTSPEHDYTRRLLAAVPGTRAAEPEGGAA
ncbi:ABC transporter ATP-binding protein [Nocardioides sp. zg-ZUI104]|uniref:ABC transporter ATP-binding protein n=1 Tax=Nocardioides faecalis TaxID=2803858 RepID=UPI001BCE6959|nr:ABC transporter ATP-binding protein [Nocardioides faecalis]MBS4754551.1 ABC transporter ATP-binding protein [Nocardioides faecalis]